MPRRPAYRDRRGSGGRILGLSCFGCVGAVMAGVVGLFVIGLLAVGLSGPRRPVSGEKPLAVVDKGREEPAPPAHEPEDDHAAEEARSRWLAEARAAKKAELEAAAAKLHVAADGARAAYKKAYHAGVAYAKQKALKDEAESLEAQAKRAQELISTADTYEPPPPVDQTPVVTVRSAGIVGSSGGVVHVKGYRRKDGTYVPPHTRSRPK